MQWLTYLNPLRYFLVIIREFSSKGSAQPSCGRRWPAWQSWGWERSGWPHAASRKRSQAPNADGARVCRGDHPQQAPQSNTAHTNHRLAHTHRPVSALGRSGVAAGRLGAIPALRTAITQRDGARVCRGDHPQQAPQKNSAHTNHQFPHTTGPVSARGCLGVAAGRLGAIPALRTRLHSGTERGCVAATTRNKLRRKTALTRIINFRTPQARCPLVAVWGLLRVGSAPYPRSAPDYTAGRSAGVSRRPPAASSAEQQRSHEPSDFRTPQARCPLLAVWALLRVGSAPYPRSAPDYSSGTERGCVAETTRSKLRRNNSAHTNHQFPHTTGPVCALGRLGVAAGRLGAIPALRTLKEHAFPPGNLDAAHAGPLCCRHP